MYGCGLTKNLIKICLILNLRSELNFVVVLLQPQSWALQNENWKNLKALYLNRFQIHAHMEVHVEHGNVLQSKKQS